MISDRIEFETVACELCGADQPDLLFTAPDRLHGLPGKFNVVRCRTCGLIYLNPRPIDMQAYYPESSYAAHAGTESGSHFAAAPLRSVGLRRRRKAVLARKRSGRLLDVGCGAGDFLHVMDQIGNWDVHGMEPGSVPAAKARQLYGLDVQVGQLEEVDIPDASFDVVTMWHVLEHVTHPRVTLQAVARVLRPDGILILACPVVDCWEARLFGPNWSGYDVPRHLYTFSRPTLRRLLVECGFSAQEVPGVVAGFNSLRISTAFWLNQRFPRLAHQRLFRVAAINLLASLFYSIARLLGPAHGPSVATFCATLDGSC